MSDSESERIAYYDDLANLDRTLGSLLANTLEQNDMQTLYRWGERRMEKDRGRENDRMQKVLELLSMHDNEWEVSHRAKCKADRKKCLSVLLLYSKDDYKSSYDLNLNTCLLIASLCNCGNDAVLSFEKFSLPTEVSECSAVIFSNLIHTGLRINGTRIVRVPILHLGIIYGNAEVCRILLNNGVNLDVKDWKGNMAIHVASMKGHKDLLRLILDKKPSLIEVKNRHGFTALYIALINKEVECVQYLLDKGAKVECRMFQYEIVYKEFKIFETLVKRIDHIEAENYCAHYDHKVGEKPVAVFNSITGDIIKYGRSVKCLSLLLKSGLPKGILQAPRIDLKGEYPVCRSPLAYVLDLYYSTVEDVDAMVDLLSEHGCIYMDEYREMLDRMGRGFLTDNIWDDINHDDINHDKFYFKDPLSVCFNIGRSKFCQVMMDKGVTVDYNLQCYGKPNMLFTDVQYCNLYHDVLEAMTSCDIRFVELCLRNSSILEPMNLCLSMIFKLFHRFAYNEAIGRREHVNLEHVVYVQTYEYLIALTPLFYIRNEYNDCNECFCANYKIKETWELFSPIANEFAKSTLQQLCRTVIRKSLREETVEDNLRYFRQSISKLPIPPYLRDYLLFKD